MYGLKEMLEKEQKHLESIIGRIKEKQDEPAPEGSLRISVNEGQIRYYHCVEDRYGSYIPMKDKELAQHLAQKAYNDAVIKKAENRLKLITRSLKDYSDNEIEQIYESLHIVRRGLITPVEPTTEQLEEQWFREPYKEKEFQEGIPLILTERGERVRSKSEKILADYFFRNDILYKYEKPLKLVGYGTVYPDFTFFSKKIRKEIYWEHEGMMDKAEYARTAVKKVNNYQMNGIYPGERLILTFETEQDLLNSKMIKQLTDKYLK
ncbi:MAG: hypothetical protein K5886_07970 [Lachnospiraceae bacterium]|nr:hypothetical protein [Lachnospiraceae bacterium]